MLSLIKNKVQAELETGGPDQLKVLQERVASLSAALYILERQLNGVKSPLHQQLRIDPLRQSNIPPPQAPQPQPQPQPKTNVTIDAIDLNPKYGWHQLELSDDRSWRWAGGFGRSALLLPVMDAGLYRFTAKTWAFDNFDIARDLQVNVFGSSHHFKRNPRDPDNIWSFEARQSTPTPAQPSICAFFYEKSKSPSEIGPGDDTRQLAFALESLSITQLRK